MTKSKNQVALNEENIRKNKRHIFELECQASTSYAESLLLIADIEENRALLSRNFSAAFNGNRAIAVDNIEDLYRCRMLMVDALTAKTDVQQNFKSAMGNSLRIDLLENKFYLNEQLQAVAEQMAAINEMLTSLNEMIADSNENLADQGGEMVSENASWIDGEIDKMFKAASSDSNADLVKSNADRLESLTGKADVAAKSAGLTVKQIESETKSIIDNGDDIAARRARIQAEREKVVANQKRSSALMSK
ncbi:MAG: Uncharacterised protein [SAR116 cluster bacterium]|nr:MAG: Uncharacterised protein [SAR116 cluster bacterium]|tara:strand:- start:224 stop:970 length:747 start_codon:yes stop_codon:yes gene_type:complete